jgi:hypothetical protein
MSRRGWAGKFSGAIKFLGWLEPVAQIAPAKSLFGYFFGDEKSNINTGQVPAR